MVLIALGYVLRSRGIVPDNTGAALKKILLDVTLPCAIVTNFSKLEHTDGQIFFIVLIGFALSLAMVAFAAVTTRRKDRARRAFDISNMPSYNIGAFCMPFVQGFLPAAGTVSVCAFDIGNSILCTGGTYAWASNYLDESTDGADWRSVARSLVYNPPLITNVAMLVLAALQIRIPDVVVSFIAPAANANSAVAMLMVGSLIRFEFKREYLVDGLRVIGARHVLACIAAPLLYWLLPFDPAVRQGIVLACFAPIPALGPPFTGMLGGDEGKAGAINSVSVILAVIELTAIITAMGLY